MKRWAVIGLIAVTAAIAGGVAYATIPDSTGVIHGCYAKNGDLRVIDPSAGETCPKNETALEWSQRGPAGPPGGTGPQGPEGPPGAAAPSPDAVDGTIAIKGQVHGDFSAAPVAIIAVSHEIVSPRDPASGLPTGKRQHKPLSITKPIDKTSPLILMALVSNENLPVVTVALHDSTGATVMTIKLTNASVASRSEHGLSETVTFTYQKITWTWVDGGITAEDDWQAPIS